MSESVKYRARWIFPIDSPPIENGVLEIESGKISAIHARSTPDAVNLGNAAILPGLINCHAHLEFSSLAEPFSSARPFASWIKSLVAYRRSQPAPPREAIRSGLTESVSAGVALVGEISTTDWPLEINLNSSPSLMNFRECLGRTPQQREEQLSIARRHLELSAVNALPFSSDGPKRGVPADAFGFPSSVSYGLSPHAPYSVHPDLLRDLVSLGVEFEAPLAMHVAETQAELELLRSGTGEIVEMLKSFGAWESTMFDGSHTIGEVLRELARGAKVLVIHGNYLSDAEIDLIAAHPQMSVVYCPRTHDYFGHEDHPWERLLARGINVALGTDGRGSNPDLSLWNEVRFLYRAHPRVNPKTLLSVATLRGACALGCENSFGSLSVGKEARLIRIPLEGASAGSDPYGLLLGAETPPQPL